MENFCKVVIKQIKSAKDERELILVINNSMRSIRQDRLFYDEAEAAYILNMIISLRANPLDLPKEMLHNINLAVNIFRQLQKENLERTC